MSVVYLEQVLLAFPRPISTLLDWQGNEYPGGNSVNKLKEPHERNWGAVTDRADNSYRYIQTGEAQGWSHGFILDAYSERFIRAFYADVNRAINVNVGSQFIIERPPIPGEERGWRHWVFFTYDDITTHFEYVTENRSMGGIQWQRATIENVRVLQSERWGSI